MTDVQGRRWRYVAIAGLPLFTAACGPFTDVVKLDEAARVRYRSEVRYYEKHPEGSVLRWRPA